MRGRRRRDGQAPAAGRQRPHYVLRARPEDALAAGPAAGRPSDAGGVRLRSRPRPSRGGAALGGPGHLLVGAAEAEAVSFAGDAVLGGPGHRLVGAAEAEAAALAG